MIRKEWVTSAPGTAALSALGSGTAVHLFGLVNVIHNYDDIAQQARGYGTGVTSGRWLLSLLGDFCDSIGGNHNLPLVNGMLFLVLIAASAGLLVSAFGIRKRNHAAIIGALFAVFPTAFSTLVFRYTAAYYGVGIVFAVLAAWVLTRHCKMRLVCSALCTACSLGIYQAYVPITITVFVIQLLADSVRKDAKLKDLIRQGVYDCVSLVLGLLVYFGLMKLTLMLYGTQLSDYQGVNEMGKLSLQTLPALLKEAVYSVIMLPVKDYCGITAMPLLKLAYVLLVGISGVMLVFLWWKSVKKPLIILFGMLMCCLIPVSVNFIVIMCPESWIYTLMIYSFVLLPCIPIILLECTEDAAGYISWPCMLEKGMVGVLALIICCYAYQTNVNYTALYYTNRQVENYLNSMVVQVRMTDGFTPDLEWAFIGEIEDPLLNSYWQYEMTYGGIEAQKWMLQRYSWPDWIRNYYGYDIPMAEESLVRELRTSAEVAGMPCWPAYGSVRVLDGIVVIKCQ